MKDDIKTNPKNHTELDSAELDFARDELLVAAESGAIREDGTEQGIDNHGFGPAEPPRGSDALSSTLDRSLRPDDYDPLSTTHQNYQTSYIAPSVDISKLPTERSRNQQDDAEAGKPSSVRITKSQSGRIRNALLASEDMKQRKPITKKTKIAIGILTVLILIIATALGATIWYRSSLGAMRKCDAGDQDHCEDATRIDFAIVEGETASDVARNLESRQVIRSALAFRIFLKLEATDSTLKSGNYVLYDDMNVSALVATFNAGSDVIDTFRITFLPGDTIMSAKAVFLEHGYSEAEIDAAFNKKYEGELFAGRPDDASIEGYIFGDTYEVYSSSTVEQILTTKVFPEMEAFVKEADLAKKFADRGMTLYEGIKLASIVYREGGTIASEMPNIASVFYNRLDAGIPLGSDAVYAYWGDVQDPNRDRQDFSILETAPCPWNSRNCLGLPTTPIASPSKEALQATAEPADTDYFYFLAGDDGKMYYGRTEAEHNDNITKYCGELCNVI